jgi:hypothetical protein
MNPSEPLHRQDVVCYHEAGHAVAYWHYGVELQCVRAVPTADDAHQGGIQTVARLPVTGVTELENEMRCDAAGDIAQRRLFPTHRTPTDPELLRGWGVFPAKLRDHPELAVEDTACFLRNGRARDEEVRNEDTGALTGPMEWLRIWREAERLIRDEVWPAVEAIAGELLRSDRGLSNADVVALAEAALGGHTR